MHWSPHEVVSATGGTLWAADPIRQTFTSISIDSRLLSPGALFVALRAERDGHEYLAAAVEAGAGGLLVDDAWARSGHGPGRPGRPPAGPGRPGRPPAGPGRRGRPPAGPELAVPVIAVADTAAALRALGGAARDRLAATVVGITGSVGKTSTKDLAAAAVGAGLRTTASEKSFNNELGVPLTLVNAPLDTEAAVIEMGARGPGHIARLCRIARPAIGVVTAAVAAHTDAFGDLEAVAAAKAELVEALPRGGTAVLNGDDPRVRAIAARTTARTLLYSTGASGAALADVFAEDVTLDDRLRPRFVCRSPWGSADVRLEARGVHQVGNALAALAVAGCCGVPLEAAAFALAEARLSPWRMDLQHTPAGAAILNDAYNANPTSMAAALEALAALPARRRVAVLGEMAELGARSDDEHRAIATLAARLGLEVLAVSTDSYSVQSVSSIDEAVAVLGRLGRGDAVLVKASRVAGLERLAARLLADGAAPA